MKSKGKMWTGSALLLGVLSIGLYGMGLSIASSGLGERGEHESSDDHSYFQPNYNRNALYEEECGSCHMAYPARLLPAQGWMKNLDQLEDHYGENAEVDDATRQQLTQYLMQASSQGTGYRKWYRTVNGESPARITDLPYFRHEHDEIPLSYVQGNDRLNNLSQCNSCHQRAEHGNFDEDEVVIPGIGRWDD